MTAVVQGKELTTALVCRDAHPADERLLLRVIHNCHAVSESYVVCVVIYMLQKKCRSCEIQDAKTAIVAAQTETQVHAFGVLYSVSLSCCGSHTLTSAAKLA